jgi:hypothetical protein
MIVFFDLIKIESPPCKNFSYPEFSQDQEKDLTSRIIAIRKYGKDQPHLHTFFVSSSIPLFSNYLL